MVVVSQTWHKLVMTNACTLRLTSTTPEQTAAIAARLGAGLGVGDVVLLSGPVGAGKSLFARALIQSRLAALGRYEDVPSPSFTLVQTYDLEIVELWHADLYRLTDPHDALELGLDQAFEEAICLVEWPERLGAFQPPSALHVTLETTDDPAFRAIDISAADMRWASLLNTLAHSQSGPT